MTDNGITLGEFWARGMEGEIDVDAPIPYTLTPQAEAELAEMDGPEAEHEAGPEMEAEA
jgi:hypothetical protein